ncbi:MAG: hypothetical protein RJA37_1799 [Verrucomicrobiota bacterium]
MELHRLGLGGAGEEQRRFRQVGARAERLAELAGGGGGPADDDARGVEAVLERAALAEELRHEDHIGLELFGLPPAEADRYGGTDGERRGGLGGMGLTQHLLDRAGVEAVGLGVVVGGSGDQHEPRAPVGLGGIERGAEAEPARAQGLLDLLVRDGRTAGVHQLHALRVDVERDDLMAAGQQDRVGQADVARADDRDLHARVRTQAGRRGAEKDGAVIVRPASHLRAAEVSISGGLRSPRRCGRGHQSRRPGRATPRKRER